MTAELCPMEPGAPVGCRGVGSGEAPRFHCRCPLGSREDRGCDGRIQCRGSLRRWSPHTCKDICFAASWILQRSVRGALPGLVRMGVTGLCGGPSMKGGRGPIGFRPEAEPSRAQPVGHRPAQSLARPAVQGPFKQAAAGGSGTPTPAPLPFRSRLHSARGCGSFPWVSGWSLTRRISLFWERVTRRLSGPVSHLLNRALWAAVL